MCVSISSAATYRSGSWLGYFASNYFFWLVHCSHIPCSSFLTQRSPPRLAVAPNMLVICIYDYLLTLFFRIYSPFSNNIADFWLAYFLTLVYYYGCFTLGCESGRLWCSSVSKSRGSHDSGNWNVQMDGT